MTVRRIVPTIKAFGFDLSEQFYGDILGLEMTMDLGWIVTFTSPSTPAAQLSLIQGDPFSHRRPDITIEVSDVDEVYARAGERRVPIVYPLTDEPWGVRRFFVVDPNGIILNVMAHRQG